MEDIINKIDEDDIIIFLDAHSSDYASDNIDTIHEDYKKVNRGILEKKDSYKYSCDIRINKLSNYEVPLVEELKIISKFNKNFLIIVDDFDLFGQDTECANWKDIEFNKCIDFFQNKEHKIFKNPAQLIIRTYKKIEYYD